MCVIHCVNGPGVTTAITPPPTPPTSEFLLSEIQYSQSCIKKPSKGEGAKSYI